MASGSARIRLAGRAEEADGGGGGGGGGGGAAAAAAVRAWVERKEVLPPRSAGDSSVILDNRSVRASSPLLGLGLLHRWVVGVLPLLPWLLLAMTLRLLRARRLPMLLLMLALVLGLGPHATGATAPPLRCRSRRSMPVSACLDCEEGKRGRSEVGFGEEYPWCHAERPRAHGFGRLDRTQPSDRELAFAVQCFRSISRPMPCMVDRAHPPNAPGKQACTCIYTIVRPHHQVSPSPRPPYRW